MELFLESIFVDSVVALEECGLHVKAVVCNGIVGNVAVVKLLGSQFHETSYENMKTTFKYPTLPTEEVHFIFDACHAPRLLRNLL